MEETEIPIINTVAEDRLMLEFEFDKLDAYLGKLLATHRKLKRDRKALFEALLNTARTDTAPSCWCSTSHDLETYGHEPCCTAAYMAIAQAESEE